MPLIRLILIPVGEWQGFRPDDQVDPATPKITGDLPELYFMVLRHAHRQLRLAVPLENMPSHFIFE